MNEKEANEFDCDLDRMVRRAFALAGSGANKSRWKKIASELENVRPLVRSMMSERDRAETA